MGFFYSKIPFLKEGPLTHYSLRVPDIPKNHLSKVNCSRAQIIYLLRDVCCAFEEPFKAIPYMRSHVFSKEIL